MTKRRLEAAQRGAGTLELALGSLLFVTVLLFGIHFAEVGFLSLKVQEAQAFGLWESTARRVHLFRASAVNGEGSPAEIYRPSRQIFANAGERAERRYRDFDGRTSRRGSANITQSVTAASPIQVTCEEEQRVDFDLPRASAFSVRARRDSPTLADQLSAMRTRYQGRGALTCKARSTLQLIRVPQGFHNDGAGGFKVAHRAREFIPVCGVGRPRNGRCEGVNAVLLGDWALEGPMQGGLRELNQDVPLRWRGRDHNRPYRIMVEALYDAGGGSHGRAGAEYAAWIGQESGNPNDAPHDEREFFMSYRGVRRGDRAGDVKDGLTINQSEHHWNTSGVYMERRRSGPPRLRADCYLGLEGCGR